MAPPPQETSRRTRSQAATQADMPAHAAPLPLPAAPAPSKKVRTAMTRAAPGEPKQTASSSASAPAQPSSSAAPAGPEPARKINKTKKLSKSMDVNKTKDANTSENITMSESVTKSKKATKSKNATEKTVTENITTSKSVTKSKNLTEKPANKSKNVTEKTIKKSKNTNKSKMVNKPESGNQSKKAKASAHSTDALKRVKKGRVSKPTKKTKAPESAEPRIRHSSLPPVLPLDYTISVAIKAVTKLAQPKRASSAPPVVDPLKKIKKGRVSKQLKKTKCPKSTKTRTRESSLPPILPSLYTRSVAIREMAILDVPKRASSAPPAVDPLKRVLKARVSKPVKKAKKTTGSEAVKKTIASNAAEKTTGAKGVMKTAGSKAETKTAATKIVKKTAASKPAETATAGSSSKNVETAASKSKAPKISKTATASIAEASTAEASKGELSRGESSKGEASKGEAPRPTTRSSKLTTGASEHATEASKPATRASKPATTASKPATRASKPAAKTSKSTALNPRELFPDAYRPVPRRATFNLRPAASNPASGAETAATTAKRKGAKGKGAKEKGAKGGKTAADQLEEPRPLPGPYSFTRLPGVTDKKMLSDDLEMMGFSAIKTYMMVEQKQSNLDPWLHPDSKEGKAEIALFRKETAAENKVKANKAQAHKKLLAAYKPLRLEEETPEWVLFDQLVHTMPADLEEAIVRPFQRMRGPYDPDVVRLFERYKTSYRHDERVVEINIETGDVRLRWKPDILLGMWIRYRNTGPVIMHGDDVFEGGPEEARGLFIAAMIESHDEDSPDNLRLRRAQVPVTNKAREGEEEDEAYVRQDGIAGPSQPQAAVPEPVAAPVPAKRGPGRPRKKMAAFEQSQLLARPALPVIIEEDEGVPASRPPPTTTKRKRAPEGDEEVLPTAPPPKRRPGRPRKTATVAAPNVPAPTAVNTSLAEATPVAPKRGPGRPRKTAAPAPPTPAPSTRRVGADGPRIRKPSLKAQNNQMNSEGF